MKAISNHKRFGAIILVALVLLGGLAIAHVAGAQTTDPNKITLPRTDTPGVLTTVFLGPALAGIWLVTYVINQFLKILISLASFLVVQMLALNSHVFDSPMVQIGFSLTLAIANLGFVLGIIIIALATILRNQTYGVKQLLWKLVAMAILVNFGLVVTRPIVAFSDSLSNNFIQSFNGGDGLASSLAGSFHIQRYDSPDFSLWNSKNSAEGCKTGLAVGTPGIPGGPILGCMFGALFGGVADAANQIIAIVLYSLFGMIFLAIAAFSLFTIAALLFVRYAYLAILLVLLPLAWLTYAFPKLGNHFSEWWQSFFRWTFFPAISLFFIYLALRVTNSTYFAGAEGIGTTNQGVFTTIIYTVMDSVVLGGLLLGGLKAADSLGIKGAGAAIGMVQSTASKIGKAAGGYATKQTAKGVRLAYQKADSKLNITGRLQRSDSRVASLAGRGIARVSTNENLVKDAEKKVSEDPTITKNELKGNMNMEDTFARIAKLIKQNELDKDTTIQGVSAPEWLDAHQDEVRRYGQGKNSKEADKAFGSNEEIRDAEKEFNKLPADEKTPEAKEKLEKSIAELKDKFSKMPEGEEKQRAVDAELSRLPQAAQAGYKAMMKLQDATNKFVDSLKKSDMSKFNVEGIFKRDAAGRFSAATEVLMKSFAEKAPQLMAPLIPKMKSQTLKAVHGRYLAILDENFRVAKASGDEDRARMAGFARKSFKNAYANNAFGFGGEEKGGGEEKKGGGDDGGAKKKT